MEDQIYNLGSTLRTILNIKGIKRLRAYHFAKNYASNNGSIWYEGIR